ncbi:MAG: hypothetical protein LBG52_02260 [Candidatus Peribacteria bacterium]|jgi:hypothetical protein|nr:hypothetical protein [Candidatus Peribacteria bacterium]
MIGDGSGMVAFNENTIPNGKLYSGTITFTGGIVTGSISGIMKFSATVSQNGEYNGSITKYPQISACGTLKWSAQEIRQNTCSYFTEPTSCNAECSWTSTPIYGNTGLVVYDELYSNTVAKLLNSRPTRDGYDFE